MRKIYLLAALVFTAVSCGSLLAEDMSTKLQKDQAEAKNISAEAKDAQQKASQAETAYQENKPKIDAAKTEAKKDWATIKASLKKAKSKVVKKKKPAAENN